MMLRGEHSHSTTVRSCRKPIGRFNFTICNHINVQAVGKHQRILLERRRIKKPFVVAGVHRKGQSPLPSDQEEGNSEDMETDV